MVHLGRGRLAGEVALITGGAGVLGREIARKFAREGAKVVVVDVDEGSAKRVVDAINAEVGEEKVSGLVSCEDVTTSKGCQAAVEKAMRRFGKLTVVCNNAGAMHSLDLDVEHTSEEIWDKTLDINLKSAFLTSKYAIPALRTSGGGSIVNVSSFHSNAGSALPNVAYTASKGAINAFTRELAVLHARENIRCNCVCPGQMNTRFLQKVVQHDPDDLSRRLESIPMGRFAEAFEVASAAMFLASKDASYITGTTLAVDGGISSAYISPRGNIDPFGGPPFAPNLKRSPN